MKRAEIEFKEDILIGVTLEPVTLNVKAVKIADSNEYQITVVMKGENKNRSKSFKMIDELSFDRDFKVVLMEWLDKYKVLPKLREELKLKFKNDFEYLDLMR